MKELLTVLFSAVVLSFSGCAGKGAGAKTAHEVTGMVNTYFQGSYIDVDTAASKLESAGFEVLAKYKSIEKGKTIVFTCPTLKAEAAKSGRAFIAVMRMFIDEKEQTISVTNPVYWGKAFMQDQYDYAKFSKVSDKINSAFPGLRNSPDEWNYEQLGTYHFSEGLPYYEKQPVVGEGSNTDLLDKAKKYKNGENFIFELKLSDTSTLIGYGLGEGTTRFPKKIGRANAGLLPWTISIEDGKAKILPAEYYIALNYPLLSMGEFIRIMSIPDSIVKDLSRPFKK